MNIEWKKINVMGYTVCVAPIGVPAVGNVRQILIANPLHIVRDVAWIVDNKVDYLIGPKEMVKKEMNKKLLEVF